MGKVEETRSGSGKVETEINRWMYLGVVPFSLATSPNRNCLNCDFNYLCLWRAFGCVNEVCIMNGAKKIFRPAKFSLEDLTVGRCT